MLRQQIIKILILFTLVEKGYIEITDTCTCKICDRDFNWNSLGIHFNSYHRNLMKNATDKVKQLMAVK